MDGVDSDIDSIIQQIADYVDKNAPHSIAVLEPGETSENEAIRDVQKQYADAGFDCDENTAREIVQTAWEQAR